MTVDCYVGRWGNPGKVGELGTTQGQETKRRLDGNRGGPIERN